MSGNEVNNGDTVSETPLHPLFEKEIQPIYNWHEWLAHWHAAKNLPWMESLLHCGFNVSLERQNNEEREYDEVDRIIFYLNVANGWADTSLLTLPTDRAIQYLDYGYKEDLSKLRQKLAQKAFNMLCHNFFKIELRAKWNHAEFHPHWKEFVTSERLFTVIQNFFKTEKMQYCNRIGICNLPFKHERPYNEQLVVDFLLNLATFLWEWKEPKTILTTMRREEYLAEMRARIDTAKPWMLEILISLDKLDVLNREWIMNLDGACLARLQEVAMREELRSYKDPVIEDHQPVASIDDACYLGSEVAWLFKKYELMTREHNRLVAIRDAECEKEEAQKKIDELKPKQ